MKHDKPLWMKIRDWLACSDDVATAIAKRIVTTNRMYWAVEDDDLKRQAEAFQKRGLTYWP